MVIFKIECFHRSDDFSEKMKSCMPKTFLSSVNYLCIIFSHCFQTLCLNTLPMNLKSFLSDFTGIT